MRELSIIVAFSRDNSIIVVPLSILILKGERAPKNAIFLVKVFQKMPKNAFLACFSQNFACGAEFFFQIWVFIVISESSENQFGSPK